MLPKERPEKGYLTPEVKAVNEIACDYVWDKLYLPISITCCKWYVRSHKLCKSLSYRPNWERTGDAERTKDRRQNIQEVGVRCVGSLAGDTQHLCCFFFTSLLLLCFFSLFKTLLLFYSLKSQSLESHCPMLPLISLKVLIPRLALSHVSSNL
jgi:hypothetical protein